MNTEINLEFVTIKEQLCGFAISDDAKARLRELSPLLSEKLLGVRLAETTEARAILDAAGAPPLPAMGQIRLMLTLCEKGAMLSPEQLESISTFLVSCRRVKRYLNRAESLQLDIAYYGRSIEECTELQQEINSSIQSAAVLSSASPALRDIRRKIEHQSVQVREKLDALLRGRKHMFTDSYVSQRNGRYVLPVKKEFKNQVAGSVVEISGTGGTYFMEPSAVARLQEEINTLKIEEDNEIRKILYALTSLVDACAPSLAQNQAALVTLDVLFAKAKLSAAMGAIPAVLTHQRSIEVRQGRHPLLSRGECVPLDFSIGGSTRGVVITGPNTGGKTVALKTVGLLSLMTQSGLHIPAEYGCFCMHNLVLCDIGDGQSIADNLSTFSAHMTNIIHILSLATPDSLVLLDEVGSGTDPAEGMGIAVSILAELRARGCLFVATTHYPEVKDYAAQTEGLVNARMAFDRDSLRPLYRLEIGEAGESCALYIAQRLGFPDHMLEGARRAAYGARLHAEHRPPVDATFGETAPITPVSAAPALQWEKPVKQGEERPTRFQLGDSVIVYPEQSLGLVYQPANAKGLVGVQIQGKKSLVVHKRIKLKTPASRLYPPDYDFSVIFDTVDNRKARHQMDKGYAPGVVITYDS